MNFKTLNTIHQLLVENEAKCKTAQAITRAARNKAEDENAENLPSLQAAHDRAFKAWSNAQEALRDFELMEWR